MSTSAVVVLFRIYALVALVTHTYAALSTVTLRPLSTTYLPSSFTDTDVPVYELDEDAAESVAYDDGPNVTYVIGHPGYLHVVTFNSTTGQGYVARSVRVSALRTTGVDACGGVVSVSVRGSDASQDGIVQFYDSYDRASSSLQKLRQQTVGKSPIELKFSADCATLVVANKGNADWTVDDDFSSFVNPEGSVTVISNIVKSGQTLNYTVRTAHFTKFNSRVSTLLLQGLHFVMQKDILNNTYTLAQDLQPETVTFSSDQSIAYVALQGNNAVAVVDLASATITAVYGLGFKDFSLENNAIDTNDNEKIEITRKPSGFYGLFQPDDIAAFSVGGNRYVVTANEGDSREYRLGNRVLFTEEVEGSYFVGKLTQATNSSLYTSITNNGDLEELRVSSAIGQNQQGLYEGIYAFGGRSFSVYRQDADEFTQVYDSGKLLAEEHASRYRDWFNGQHSRSKTLSESFDSRSDRKGVETEAMHLTTIGGDRVLFLGNERTSTIFVFGLENPSSPELFSTATNVNTQLDGNDAYDERTLGDADPEKLIYVPSASSPVPGKPVLIVAGAFSGTVSLYEVNYTCAANHTGEDCSPITSPTPTSRATSPSTSSAARSLYAAIDVISVLLFVIAVSWSC